MSLTRQQKLREENDRLYKIIDEKIESVGELVMDAERLARAGDELREWIHRNRDVEEQAQEQLERWAEARAAHEKLVTS